MSLLHFDKDDLSKEIEKLPLTKQVAFAASCASRLSHAYREYCTKTGFGDSVLLMEYLTRLWDDLICKPLNDSELDEMIPQCVELAPDDETTPHDGRAAAQNAVSATCCALECRRHGLTERSALAAQVIYDAMDNFIVSRSETSGFFIPNEEKINAEPVIQNELARQKRDLEDLAANRISFDELRKRSFAESYIIFLN